MQARQRERGRQRRQAGPLGAVTRRRGLLSAGAAFALAVAAGGLTRGRAVRRTSAQADFPEPPPRASANGVLNTSLTAAPQTLTYQYTEQRGGVMTPVTVQVNAMLYEGGLPGPTLQVQPGDTLRIALTNGLPGAAGIAGIDHSGRDEIHTAHAEQDSDTNVTNLHTHGFHVSPRDNSDNVFLQILPGATQPYEIAIPANHPAGLYWYHPHFHGQVFTQVDAGMAGAIIIRGDLDDLPGVRGLRERLLVLQSPSFGTSTTYHTVNGRLSAVFPGETGVTATVPNQPVLPIRPGETQRWRIANASADTFYQLQLDGHQLNEIAADGNTLGRVWVRDTILIAPGERVELLIQASTTPGSYALRSLPLGAAFRNLPGFTFATMAVQGVVETASPLPDRLLPFEDLRGLSVDRRRELVFSVLTPPGAPFPNFVIDNRDFDPGRIDQLVDLNAVEEWTVYNDSDEWHPFHIHVNPFQVVAVNGAPVPAHGYEDTVPLPARDLVSGVPGSVTFRTRFLDFTGRYVYHCHLVFHEDHSMMGVVLVR